MHGQTGLLDAVVDRYGSSDVNLVSNGDLIGGPDTFGSIQTVLDVGITAVYGNHEWALDSALQTEDPEILEELAVVGHSRYFRTIYPSYGINGIREQNPSNTMALEALQSLKLAIKEAGHEEYFEHLRLYFQTGSFLAIHAGVLPNKPWFGNNPQMSQKAELDKMEAEIHTREFDWTAGPPIQITDNCVYSLSSSIERPAQLRDLILITGHNHKQQDETMRITGRGKRASLGDGKNLKGPLYVWES